MRLETHEGLFTDSAAVADVLRVVRGLTAVGEAYVILSDTLDAETYVQAAGSLSEDFILERRDGCAGEHYRGDRRVGAVELAGILIGFLRGTSDWSHTVTWHHVCVAFGVENARACCSLSAALTNGLAPLTAVTHRRSLLFPVPLARRTIRIVTSDTAYGDPYAAVLVNEVDPIANFELTHC